MNVCPQCDKSFSEIANVCPHDGRRLLNIPLAADDPLIGKRLAGRFLIISKLGEGGMGKVYKAMQTQMDRLCAIKLLTTYSANRQLEIDRFRREARMASMLDNPHVVAIYDFDQTDGDLFYLAMEYVEGRSLDRVLTMEAPVTAERAVRIIEQVAEGLAAAHAVGIVHRDIKPDNIMLTQKDAQLDFVKLLDFGIARPVNSTAPNDALTRTGYILGTPFYMSPEQVMGEPLDGRSDVYSLALIAYQMLSGRLPFEADSTQAVMLKRLSQEPTSLRTTNPSVSLPIERAIMSGLERRREMRIDTVSAFALALRDALRQNQLPDTYASTLADISPVAGPPPVTRTPSQNAGPVPENAGRLGIKSHKKKATVLSLVLGAIVIAVLFGIYSRSDRSSTPPDSPKGNPTVAETAEEHNGLGKSHQEQARALKKAGLSDNAVDQNLKAIEEFRKAIALRAAFPEAHENLGLAYSDDCDNLSASPEFRVAIDQSIQSGERPSSKLWTNYGLVLYDLKLHSEAAHAFEEALRLNQSDVELYALMGFAYQKAGEINRANEAYRQYLNKDHSGRFAAGVKAAQAGTANPPDSSGDTCFRKSQ